MPDWKYIQTTHSILLDLEKAKQTIEKRLKNIEKEGARLFEEQLCAQKQFPTNKRASFFSRLFK